MMGIDDVRGLMMLVWMLLFLFSVGHSVWRDEIE